MYGSKSHELIKTILSFLWAVLEVFLFCMYYWCWFWVISPEILNEHIWTANCLETGISSMFQCSFIVSVVRAVSFILIPLPWICDGKFCFIPPTSLSFFFPLLSSLSYVGETSYPVLSSVVRISSFDFCFYFFPCFLSSLSHKLGITKTPFPWYLYYLWALDVACVTLT